MNVLIKLPCSICNQPYLSGKGGICIPCQRGRKPNKLFCDCGKPAVAVLITNVGSSEIYTVEIPVCRDCLSLELED